MRTIRPKAPEPTRRTSHVLHNRLTLSRQLCRHDIDYSIAILTRDDPDMAYGVAVVETVARLINRALAEADGEGADPGATTSPQRFRNLAYTQRRLVR